MKCEIDLSSYEMGEIKNCIGGSAFYIKNVCSLQPNASKVKAICEKLYANHVLTWGPDGMLYANEKANVSPLNFRCTGWASGGDGEEYFFVTTHYENWKDDFLEILDAEGNKVDDEKVCESVWRNAIF